MSTTAELEQFSRFLRNAAPQEYEKFCLAFGNYTRAATEAMINASGDLSLAQGRAQQCLKILRVLEGAKNG